MAKGTMDILIAEDDGLTLRLLTTVLEGLGHKVVGVENGELAWQRYAQSYFPVLITDWNMPETDGMELTRRVRQVARYREYTWIIMLTAMDFSDNYVHAMESGVDDYLNKPLDPEYLRVRLHVAQRVVGMFDRIKALESCLPICMYCKDIRDTHDQWTRVERFFSDTEGKRFTHGLCPRCYYARVLRADLDEFKLEYPPAETVAQRVETSHQDFDTDLHDALTGFGRAKAPGLLRELRTSFKGAAQDIKRVLDARETSTDNSLLVRSATRFRALCVDLGMFGLARHLDPEKLDALSLLPGQDDAQSLDRIRTEIDRAVETLELLGT